MNPIQVKPNATQKKVYTSVIEKLEKSQKLKERLIPYLEEKYPHLLQKKGRKERIKECGNSVTFRRYYDTGDIKLLSGSFCKYDRVCIACATKRAMRMIKKFSYGIKVNNLYQKNWYYIVLTIKHSKDNTLEELLDKLTKAKDKLARNYRNSKRKGQKKKSFVSLFDGFAISIEVSHKGSNGWHPHINIIGCTDEILPIHNAHNRGFSNNDIVAEWKEITGDSFIHNVRKITINEKSPFSRSGLGEVFKYAIKFSDLSLEQLAEIMNLQNKNQYRFFATYGIFRGWKLENIQKEKGQWSEGTFLREEGKYEKIQQFG